MSMRTLPAMFVTTALWAAASSHAQESTWQIEAHDVQSLQRALLSLAEEQLQPLGLHVDSQRARLNLSAALPSADSFVVRTRWNASGAALRLPLVFELKPRLQNEALGDSIVATLGVALERDVWIATRRLRKGSKVTCAELTKARRRVREASPQATQLECEILPGSVALREVVAGDVVRSVDIGEAPAVAAGSSIDVISDGGGISVSTKGIALEDAKVGDRVDVRLPRPTRMLRGRVTGPGQVQLGEGSR